MPSSYCGIFGLRPTWGAVSTVHTQPLAPSLDTSESLSVTLLAQVALGSHTGGACAGGFFARDLQTLQRVAEVLLLNRQPEAMPLSKLLVASDAVALAEKPIQAALRQVML